MRIITILTVIVLSGCANFNVNKIIPSFSDPNQSRAIVDVRQSIINLDCEKPQLAQVTVIRANTQWFDLYSESKGSRQTDVRDLVHPLAQTVEDFYQRVQVKDASPAYCEIKRKIMIEQSSRAATVILGRF